VQLLWKAISRSLKSKKRATIQSRDTTPLYISEIMFSRYDRATCTPMFIAALFIIAKLWSHPRCPTTDEWIKKMLYIYTI
jgi:hypothetical protein